MNHIQIVGPFRNTPPSTAGTATRNEVAANGGDAARVAAVATPENRLGSHTVADGVKAPAPTPDPQVQEAIDKINRSANFRVEMEAAKGMALPVITIRDRVTGEIISQMPPKAFVAAAGKIDSTFSGLFEKVA